MTATACRDTNRCSILGAWASGTHRCRGPSSSGGCPTAARRAPPRGTAAATARRGPASASPTSPSSSAGPARCPTPSCTATPTSASSTAPPTPRSWPRRRPASASRPWPSPTTTASTAWSASPRRPGPSGCPPSSGPSSPSAVERYAARRVPDPDGHHLRRAGRRPRRATPAWRGPSAGARWRGRRARPGSPWPSRGRGRAERPLAGAHRVPQGGGARGRWSSRRAGRGGAASWSGWSRPSGASAWPSSCGTTATRSTRPATTPWPSWRCGPGSTWWPPTTSTTPPPPAGPLATALAAVRARRSLDEIDGWLPAAPAAHLRSGAEQARRFARYPGVVERAAELGRACAFDLAPGGPRPAAVPVPATATTEMSYLRRLAEQGGRATATAPAPAAAGAPGRRRRGPDRPRARRHRAARLPRLLPHRVGHRRVLPRGRHLLPGPGLGGQLGGLLRARHHQRRRRPPRPAVRAVPVARARRPARHRRRHRERPAGGGHPVRLRALRPRPRRPGGQRHHLPGHARRCATWPRPSGYAPGQQDAWSKQVDGWGPVACRGQHGPTARPTTTSPPTVLDAGRPGRALPPPPRHPLGRHGASATGRWSRCARSSGAAWRTAASCSGTRTTARRSAW